MSLMDTPSGERVHIGIFGKRNAGKSTVINAVTGQELSIVSPVEGTTTDPVRKAMELLPIGPVLVIDTPGYDDVGMLGQLRVQKTREILRSTDIALLVTEAEDRDSEAERELIGLFTEKGIPYLIVRNKSDLLDQIPPEEDREIYVSGLKKTRIEELKERIARVAMDIRIEKYIVKDMVSPGDFVLLVIPIDAGAPKGRLILPQQQVLREILELGACPVCVTTESLTGCLDRLKETPPALVITDSQVFGKVAQLIPEEYPLTSFSILMARYKGFLADAWQGAARIGDLKDGDRVLISEGCTHHRQCEDIGTVKLPKWLREYTGHDIEINTSSGREFPEDLSDYALVIHCGACMLNEKEMQGRVEIVREAGIPITNYGIAIAFMKGILERSVRPLPSLETCRTSL